MLLGCHIYMINYIYIYNIYIYIQYIPPAPPSSRTSVPKFMKCNEKSAKIKV